MPCRADAHRDVAGIDFVFPQEFDTLLDAAAAAVGARFEIRRFFWRERSEIVFAPPCSYFELTSFPAIGRYVDEAGSGLCRQGDVRFYPASRAFHTRWRRQEQRSLFCRIDIPAITGLPMELADHQLHETIDMDNRYIKSLLLRAEQELTAPGLCSQMMLDSISVALAAEMVQQFGGQRQPHSRRRRALDQPYLRSLVARIREDAGRIDTALLATECGVSIRHYERLFRAATGTSPAAFCRHHMLALAKDLLANRSLLIKEIAYRCGFVGTAPFSVAFRKIEGCSPQQFRDRLIN